MLGFLFLLFAVFVLLLGLNSYRRRRAQQAASYVPQNDPGYYNNQTYYSNTQTYYGPPPRPSPPVYNNAGRMETGLVIVQMPPPVYTPYEASGAGGGKQPDYPEAASKGGFRGWIRGG